MLFHMMRMKNLLEFTKILSDVILTVNARLRTHPLPRGGSDVIQQRLYLERVGAQPPLVSPYEARYSPMAKP